MAEFTINTKATCRRNSESDVPVLAIETETLEDVVGNMKV